MESTEHESQEPTHGDEDAVSWVADLAECVAPLDGEGRRAVRRYWDQVIREEWVPAERRVPRLVPIPDLDERRERRRARRAMSQVAEASRVASVVVFPATQASTGGGEAA